MTKREMEVEIERLKAAVKNLQQQLNNTVREQPAPVYITWPPPPQPFHVQYGNVS